MGKLDVLSYVNKEYEELKKVEHNKSLNIIQVGDDESSNKYINNKIKRCKMLGIKYKHFKLDDNISGKDFKDITEYADRDSGKIIIQEPIPARLKGYLYKIDSSKDVDGTSLNTKIKRIKKCEGYSYEPATARGIVEYMQHLDENLAGKKVLIINRSELVGKRLKELLLKRDMLVSVAHSKVSKERIEKEFRTCDYIISGVGIPKYFNWIDIPEGATFIDVSINFDENGKMCGELNLPNNEQVVPFNYTPVPNGVGQLTVLALMKNIFDVPFK